MRVDMLQFVPVKVHPGDDPGGLKEEIRRGRLVFSTTRVVTISEVKRRAHVWFSFAWTRKHYTAETS